MVKVSEAHQEAFAQAISDEEKNNPEFVRGRKWARIWTIIWAVVAASTIILPMIVNAISEEFPLILLNFVAVLVAVVLVLMVPFGAHDGSTRHVKMIMALASGYSLAGLLPDPARTIFTILPPVLMVPLTVLIFFQPSIRHASARYEELYARHILLNIEK